MSLKKKTGSDANSVVNQVNNFENRLNALQKEQGNIAQASKRNTMKKALKDLAQLAAQIAPVISTADPATATKYSELSTKFNSIKSEIERQIEAYDAQAAQEQKKAAQSAAAQGQTGQLTSSLLDDQTQEVDMLANQTGEILEDMKALNEITVLVNDKIQEQHEVVVRVDDKIEETHEEMVAGNADLKIGEEYQKSSNKCLWYILGVVILAIIVIILILYFTVWKKSGDQPKK